jgi:short-subunit dehydrogenase
MSKESLWALVTGASSGIGREIALLLADRGWNVIAAARSQEKLDALCTELMRMYSVEAQNAAVDLSRPCSAAELYQICRAKKDADGNIITVSLLVNNAGAGLFGESTDLSSSIIPVLQLNIIALTELCALFGADMKARSSGSILNIGSLTANQPSPYFASYGASKSYVKYFSLALREELKPYGVNVSCVQPGYIRTSFDDKCRITSEKYKRFSYKNGMRPEQVAQIALRAEQRKRPCVNAGWSNTLMAFAAKLIPAELIASILAHSVRALTSDVPADYMDKATDRKN